MTIAISRDRADHVFSGWFVFVFVILCLCLYCHQKGPPDVHLFRLLLISIPVKTVFPDTLTKENYCLNSNCISYTDKLLIPVAGDPGLSRGRAGDGGPRSLSKVEEFDPDTLERGTDRRGETNTNTNTNTDTPKMCFLMTDFLQIIQGWNDTDSDILSDARMTETTEGEESEGADRQAVEEEATQRVHPGTPAAGEYSFRLFPVGEAQERAPFPLPAPFDKRLPGDRRSFAGEKFGQQTNENLASSAPALPPKKGRREN